MRPKIINILPHEPDYEFVGERPEVHWDTSDGQWVGIYRNEIPDKLGREVLQYTDDFEYEVWQPDYRADQVYSHRFEDDGLVHRLFPATTTRERHGLKTIEHLHTPTMEAYLDRYVRENEVVINMNGDLTTTNLSLLSHMEHLPVLQSFRGTINLPHTQIFRPRRNFLASFSYLQQHFQVKKHINYVDHVSYQNNLYMKALESLYSGPKTKITSGCNFSYWRKLDKAECRAALGLPAERPILLVSSLLIMRKQIDKLIEVLIRLSSQHDFLLIVSGHGTDEYEAYLKTLAEPLLEQDRIRFVGFLKGDEMLRYFNSADLFVNPSKSEGGPVSAMKAIACEVPLFSTDSGNVAERMRDNGTGILVGTEAYDEWEKRLHAFLSGQPVTPFDRQEAKAHYDWQTIAGKFVEIYQTLHRRYYHQPVNYQKVS